MGHISNSKALSHDDHLPTYICSLKPQVDLQRRFALAKLSKCQNSTSFPVSVLPPLYPHRFTRMRQVHGVVAESFEDPKSRARLQRCPVTVSNATHDRAMYRSSSARYEIEKYLQDVSAEPMHIREKVLLRSLWARYEAFAPKVREANESERFNPFPDLGMNLNRVQDEDCLRQLNTTIVMLNEIVEHAQTGRKGEYNPLKGRRLWDRAARADALSIVMLTTRDANLEKRIRTIGRRYLCEWLLIRLTIIITALYFLARDILKFWKGSKFRTRPRTR